MKKDFSFCSKGLKVVLLFVGALLMGVPGWALSPEPQGKMVTLGADFLAELRILLYVMLVIAFLVANILLLLVVKDPSRLSLKAILGHFVGKDAPDTMTDHAYDGIQELDNPMPAWLRWLFYGSIGFAGIYLIHYHWMGTGPLSRAEYEVEMAVAAEKYKDVELPEGAILQLTDAGRLQNGASLFKENCATCHGEKLEGLTGPNLTDAYWLHGGDIKAVYNTITNGVPGKTMISWKSRISSNERLELASYVLSLQGSNPANAKSPEGTLAGASPVHLPDTNQTDSVSSSL